MAGQRAYIGLWLLFNGGGSGSSVSGSIDRIVANWCYAYTSGASDADKKLVPVSMSGVARVLVRVEMLGIDSVDT